jgi:hypothetical protein
MHWLKANFTDGVNMAFGQTLVSRCLSWGVAPGYGGGGLRPKMPGCAHALRRSCDLRIATNDTTNSIMTDAPPPPTFVSGKVLVLATFAVGIAMSVTAWFYNYTQSDQAAEFWRGAAPAIVRGEKVTLFELGEPGGDGPHDRRVIREFDLTGKQGLVHLRHAITYDANFDWDSRRQEPVGAGGAWPYAFEFAAEAEGGQPATVWFSRKFDAMARAIATDAEWEFDILPCPRLAPVIPGYLERVGVKLASDEPQQDADAPAADSAPR